MHIVVARLPVPLLVCGCYTCCPLKSSLALLIAINWPALSVVPIHVMYPYAMWVVQVQRSHVCLSFSYDNCSSSVKSTAAHLILTRCALRLLVVQWYLVHSILQIATFLFCCLSICWWKFKTFPHIAPLAVRSGDLHGWTRHTLQHCCHILIWRCKTFFSL